MKSFLKQIHETPTEFFYHIIVFVLGIMVAFLIAHSTIFGILIEYSQSFYFLTSFIAGFFFTSMATIAPATVAIFQISQSDGSLLLIAVFGGLGAMLGDLFLFQMIKFSLVDDFIKFLESKSRGHLKKLLRIKMFSISMVVLGAIIVASPLPDELGLAMMGLAKVRKGMIMIISFLLNTAGILLVGLTARGFLSS